MKVLLVVFLVTVVLTSVKSKAFHRNDRRPRHLPSVRPDVSTGIPTVPLHEHNKKLQTTQVERHPARDTTTAALVTRSSATVKAPLRPANNRREAAQAQHFVQRTPSVKKSYHVPTTTRQVFHATPKSLESLKVKTRKNAKSRGKSFKKTPKHYEMENKVKPDKAINKHSRKMFKNHQKMKSAMAKIDANKTAKYRANLKAKLAQKNKIARTNRQKAVNGKANVSKKRVTSHENMRKYMAKKQYWKKQQARNEMRKKMKYARANKKAEAKV